MNFIKFLGGFLNKILNNYNNTQYISLFLCLIPSASAHAVDCRSLLNVTGFKAAAQVSCHYLQFDNDAIQAARRCASARDPAVNISEIGAGTRTFEALEQKLGHENACNNVFRRFWPLFKPAGPGPIVNGGLLPRPRFEHDTPPEVPRMDSAARRPILDGLNLKAATLHGERGVSFDHNGSQVLVFEHAGLVVYDRPKATITDAVEPGDILFSGHFGDAGHVEGTAFTFRRGCDPAPYHVTGWFAGVGYGRENTIVLKGAAPVRQASSCFVKNYSTSSANATLRIDFVDSDI